MRIVKSVVQNCVPSEEILGLLEDFRQMINDCIRIGIGEKVTSMKSLSMKAYYKLSKYDVATYYRLSASSKAAGLLRNYRKSLRNNPSSEIPYVKKAGLTDCYGFRIEGNRLRLAIKAHNYVYFDLSPHTIAAISGHSSRSVTLTTHTLSIAYSREVEEMKPVGLIAIDRNLDNLTLASSDGRIQKFDLSKATEIKGIYREVKSHLTRDDDRVRRNVFGKYGRLQRHRVGWILNNVSASIVKQAKENRRAIVMEDIKGIRKLYRKGNGQGKNYRAMLNSWSYAELERQIEYKARWEGIHVIYVTAWGTSTKCAICGTKTAKVPNAHRMLYCPKCKVSFDRDENAARNILAKGALRFGAIGLPELRGEAVKGNETRTPIPRADGRKEAS